MNSKNIKFVVLLLIVGLLSACGSQPTEAPTTEPTKAAATATDAPTRAPAATDTSAPTAAPVESSPTTVPAISGPSTVSFANEILPLLQSRCSNCHGGSRTEEGLSLRTYESVMTGSESGAVIIPGDAANSLLYQMVESQEMPKRGAKLTPDQLQLILTWINEGAQDN